MQHSCKILKQSNRLDDTLSVEHVNGIRHIIKLLHRLLRWRMTLKALSFDQTTQRNPRTFPLSWLFNISLRIWTCNSSTTAHNTQTETGSAECHSVTFELIYMCVLYPQFFSWACDSLSHMPVVSVSRQPSLHVYLSHLYPERKKGGLFMCNLHERSPVWQGY